MANTPDIEELINKKLDELLPQKLDALLQERAESKTPSMAIIATKGTLDWGYPPFILASTAAALGWDVTVFFTFYGLQLVKKDISRASTGTSPTSSRPTSPASRAWRPA